MRDDLIGYLIGALDDKGREKVESRLKDDPKLQEDLETLHTALDPLAVDETQFVPPSGLADSTCQLVSVGDKLQTASRVAECAGINRSRRRSDMVVVVGIMGAAAMLFFPAIMKSRTDAHLLACQDNMQILYRALTGYSEQNGGYPPKVDSKGKLAFTGIYAPKLVSAGYVGADNRVRFICPGAACDEKTSSVRLPTMQEIKKATGEKLEECRRVAGGSYGYTFGFLEAGRYVHRRLNGAIRFVLLADACDESLDRRCSSHHGCHGQNVLYNDGKVVFLQACIAEGCTDDIYRNDSGLIAAGLSARDSVVAKSSARPFPAEFMMPPSANPVLPKSPRRSDADLQLAP